MYFIILLISRTASAFSFNLVNLSSNDVWSENAITVANNDTIGGPARALFIDRNDTIFIGAYQKKQILIWLKDSVLPVQIDHVNLYDYSPLFVTDNNDIYFQDKSEEGLINKWSMTSHEIIYVVKFTSHCRGLFITDDNTIYCSQFLKPQVVRLSLNTTHENETIVAGTDVSGNAMNQFNAPWGIYVDQNLNLFVADFWNHRIQLFESGKFNGTTVAGGGIPQGLILNNPTDMTFDVNSNMYISDAHNHRVIRVSENQWNCIVGCSGVSGVGPNYFHNAYGFRFDTFGNLYVADEFNNRIQKFLLQKNLSKVTNTTIIITCFVQTMSHSNKSFYYVNTNSQLQLHSTCADPCPVSQYIEWKIYQGSTDLSNYTLSWTSFSSDHIFGLQSQNLTIPKSIFIENNQTLFWRFEVKYTFPNETPTRTFDIEINQPPQSGSCSIHPSNGTILTLFTISCLNWTDSDGIKDYSIYVWKNDLTQSIMITLTNHSIFQVRLPSTFDQSSSYHLVVHIRDSFDSTTSFQLSSVEVFADNDIIQQLIQLLQNNDVQQISTVCSHYLNEINQHNIQTLTSNGIPAVSVAITPLDNHVYQYFFKEMQNNSIFIEIQKQINDHAQIREYLINIIVNRSAANVDDIKLQSSLLSLLTRSTNQLTTKTSILASTKCQQLSEQLLSLTRQISFEDTQFIANHLLQCSINSFNGVNGFEQKRTILVDSSVESNRKQILNKIYDQYNQMVLLITSTFDQHLNINQTLIINSTSIIFSLQKIFSFSTNKSILIRKIVEPLAFADFSNESFTNLSRSISFSHIDQNQTEFFIPRDPNLIVPEFILQNLKKLNNRRQLFVYHQINLTQHSFLSFSIHFQLLPQQDSNVSYLIIYKFDSIPSVKRLDGSNIFTPENLNDDGIYHLFIDNQHTVDHKSIFFGVRELTQKEIDQPVKFTANYSIRIFQSACLYLDSNRIWQSQRLIVGPLTDQYQTHCLFNRSNIFDN